LNRCSLRSAEPPTCGSRHGSLPRDSEGASKHPFGGRAGLLGSPPMTGLRGRTPWALAAACSGLR
jgi:hypothetical protein